MARSRGAGGAGHEWDSRWFVALADEVSLGNIERSARMLLDLRENLASR